MLLITVITFGNQFISSKCLDFQKNTPDKMYWAKLNPIWT